jgi:predicted HicB family RNase H-like nuclease
MEKGVKTIRVDPDLWRRARAKALNEKTTMQDLITKLLTEYLKKGGKGKA